MPQLFAALLVVLTLVSGVISAYKIWKPFLSNGIEPSWILEVVFLVSLAAFIGSLSLWFRL